MRKHWEYEFEESGGYDCMTDAFYIRELGSLDSIAVLDFSSYGQRACKPYEQSVRRAAEEDAALIVRAVNAHEALISSMENLLSLAAPHFSDSVQAQAVADAKAALKLAKGEA